VLLQGFYIICTSVFWKVFTALVHVFLKGKAFTIYVHVFWKVFTTVAQVFFERLLQHLHKCFVHSFYTIRASVFARLYSSCTSVLNVYTTCVQVFRKAFRAFVQVFVARPLQQL
jgi:hypothetical protein